MRRGGRKRKQKAKKEGGNVGVKSKNGRSEGYQFDGGSRIRGNDRRGVVESGRGIGGQENRTNSGK